ncbi:MAG: LysR family transcriptional regulator [Paucibacter sp.]|nr:LysR family transcriptional regulator [Roseateles sp.]
MNTPRQRPLAVGTLRAFEAVARHLSFRVASEELHLTQSAVSRQIQALEEEIGATLFLRGTRHVELTADGQTLLAAVTASLPRLDQAVRQIRQRRGRRVVNVTTFASFASLWLLPRLEAFQREHPDIDIRVSAQDQIVAVDDSEFDLALRYTERPPAGALRLFGELLTPVAGRGATLPREPAELANHTLAEEDSVNVGPEVLSWRRWLREQGLPQLEPRRWLYLNFTYQQVQAALSGHALALARLPLVSESLIRGDLVEPFGPALRLPGAHSYWLVPGPRVRPEVQRFCEWIGDQAAQTRHQIGEP